MVELGDEIVYDLLESGSGLDRRKGLFLYHQDKSHTAEGTVVKIGEDHVIVTGRGYLGHKKIPLGAIL